MGGKTPSESCMGSSLPMLVVPSLVLGLSTCQCMLLPISPFHFYSSQKAANLVILKPHILLRWQCPEDFSPKLLSRDSLFPKNFHVCFRVLGVGLAKQPDIPHQRAEAQRFLSTATKSSWGRWGSWHRACRWGQDRKRTNGTSTMLGQTRWKWVQRNTWHKFLSPWANAVGPLWKMQCCMICAPWGCALEKLLLLISSSPLRPSLPFSLPFLPSSLPFLPFSLPSLPSLLPSFPPSLPSFLPFFLLFSFSPFLLFSFSPFLLFSFSPFLLFSFSPFLLFSFLFLLFSFSPFLLFSFSPFLLFSFSPFLLFSFSPFLLFSFSPFLLFSFSPFLLFSFSPFLLFSFSPFFHYSTIPLFLSSILPSFHPSTLPSFHPSFLHFLLFFLSSFLPFFLSSFPCTILSICCSSSSVWLHVPPSVSEYFVFDKTISSSWGTSF